MELPAQIFRKNFAFQNWKNYDKDLFEKIKESRLNRIREFSGKIIGYDIDNKAISAAKTNVEFTELNDVIEIKKQNFFDSKKEVFPLLVVFNPPYGERLATKEEDFYKKIGDTFKQNYPNTLAWLITSDLEAYKKIGLRPSRKIKLFNGKLECRLLQYEMYAGKKGEGKL
jgi:putative N6-adenine-specific DNA methylase